MLVLRAKTFGAGLAERPQHSFAMPNKHLNYKINYASHYLQAVMPSPDASGLTLAERLREA